VYSSPPMGPTLFLSRLSSLLFGFDFFISYRRQDAAQYAEALNASLSAKGFVCFLDRDHTVGGVELTPALRRSLRRSRALVVLLTPGVVDSSWVEQEIASFVDRGDRLVPISVDGFLSREIAVESFAQLKRLSWIEETAGAVKAGIPSDHVVPDIRKNYDRRRVRTYARLLGLALLAGLLVGGSYVGVGLREDRRQRQVAYDEIRLELGHTKTLLRLTVRAAQHFKAKVPVSIQLGSSGFDGYTQPDVIAIL